MICFLVLIFISGNSIAQTELTGAVGLSFGISTENVKSIMSKRSGTVDQSGPNYLSYNDVMIGTKKADILFLQFVNNKLHTIKAMFLPEFEAKTQDLYDELKEIITSKYGKSESYRNFKTPYEDGDGYEMQAVKLGKADISSYWKFPSDRIISLNIESTEKIIFVSMVYQDGKLFQEVKQKQENKNMNDF